MNGNGGMTQVKGYGIAIIGMALKFPKASTPEEFWHNIYEGRNCIENLSNSELLAAGVSEDQIHSHDYVKVKGGAMDSPHEFDAGLFHYTESEARAMEPQMRIFHEIVWKALENAGYDPRRVPGSVGVYAGAAPNLYWQYLNITKGDDSISSQVMLDNLISTHYLPTRVSYNFGFEGPSVFIYTACSTSLVTVHMACRALLGGECDVAIAGGSSILGDNAKGYIYEEGMILSPDGQCRAFDQKAQGTIPGEGVGVIVLKPLDAALQDGDNILGVIRSSAINNDGKRKVGYSAPSIYAQADVIKTAMAIGDIAPGELSYIETHGTGTLLGDSVEIEGLKLAMDAMNNNKKCVLGSLKPNIGHLDSAAGIAGIIKVILAMKNKTLPPTIHCDSPIPALADENSMFTILREPAEWDNGDFPLVAGVSAFGIGGTNAHVIIEEAPRTNKADQSDLAGGDVVLLSERSQSALDQLSKELVACIADVSINFESLVFTLKTGRHSFNWRRMLLGSGLQDLKEGLLRHNYRDHSAAGRRSRVAIVFSGLETDNTVFGKELYTQSHHFQTYLDKCFHIINDKCGIELKSMLEQQDNVCSHFPQAATLIRFCVAVSLADALKVYGILPEIATGESWGELAAAYTAGMFQLEDLLPFIVHRLQQSAQADRGLTPPTLKAPQATMISSATGEPVSAGQSSYWEHWAARPLTPLIAGKISRSLCADENITILHIGRESCLTAALKESIKADFDQEMLDPLAPPKEGMSERSALHYALGVLWLKGWDVQWQKTYAKRSVNKVVLPGIRFERKDYSIDAAQLHPNNKTNFSHDDKTTSDLLYTLFWKQKCDSGTSAEDGMEKRWLIFCDEFGIAEQLAGKLGDHSCAHILVRGGEAYQVLGDNSFVIRHGALDDYQLMFSHLAEKKIVPSHILHCFSLTAPGKQSGKDFDEAQNRGMYSLLNIAKCLKAFEQSNQTVMNVITENLYRLCDESRTFPDTATLMGPLKVIPQEYPFLICRNIDIDTAGSWEAHRETALAMVCNELLQAVESPVVAIRGKRKWVQDFQALKLPDVVYETGIRNKGTYIIFGGLGDVGFSFASLLASQYEANLILAGKSRLAASHADGPFANNRLDQTRTDRLNKLKAYNTEIHYYSLDVADAHEVRKFFDEVKSNFRGYDGVIYAAGTVSGPGIQFIDSLKKSDCESQFLTKVHGVANVSKVLAEDKPELCLFISSIASLLGGMEFAAYSGANAFLDSYILEQNYQHNMAWKVVNWDGMSILDSMKQFDRIASIKGIEQIFVSAGEDLKERLSRWVDRHEVDESAIIRLDDSGEIRNRLTSEYQAPERELEKKLVKIWQSIFGIADIGIKDSFFELGGDSLKALNFLSILHKELHVKVSVKDFYRNLTIRQLVDVIEGLKHDEYIPMKKAEEKALYRLTPGQKRMYILWKMNKNSIAYNQTYILQVKGKLEFERLLQAFSKLASRHDAFRTSVVEQDGKPYMKVAPHLPPVCKLIETDEMTLEPTIQGLVKPFNLLEAPLYRANVLKVSDDYFVLVLDFHHILVDGVSFKIMIRELMELYNGEEPEVQLFQYKDYSEWLHEPAQQERMRQDEQYWLEQFKEEIPLLDLKSDRARPANLSYKGDSVSFYFDTDLTLAIKKSASELGISLYVFLLTAYYVLLNKLTGQETIIVGTPVAGRENLDLGNIVGFFVNSLALKAEPAGSDTFRSFAKQVKEVVLEAFDHQLYPFDELVKKVGSNKISNRNPLFDTMFVFQNMMNDAETAGNIPGLEITPYPYKNKTAQFDITVIAEERNDKILFEFEYFTDLFDKETILRYKEYFIRIIEQCLTDTHISLKDIRVLAPDQEKALLANLHNHDPAAIYEHNSIQGLFEQAAAKYPTNQALVYEGESLTYQELNERANRLAHFLRRNGVTNNTMVGMLLASSAQIVVTILAVLKAGGAYLPIDPLYPRARIEQILSDSKAKYLLHEDDGLSGDFGEMRVINLRSIDLVKESAANPENLTDKEDGAYVIYTSGTTGVPKGVMINHHNVIRLFFNHSPVFDFNAEDRWILCHSCSFDFSVWEIFGALLWGGALVVIPHHVMRDPRALYAILLKERITVLNQTPSAFIPLQAEILRNKQNSPAFLRYVIFGGENLKPYHLKAFKEQFPQTRLVNMYGITEITVHGTYKEIGSKEIERNLSNIGKPLPTLNMYLLDKYLKLVPPGVPGEIYVGGEGVSRGYLNNPQLTAERFIPNPYNKDETIYKTGDLAFIDTNGELIYIGRNDHQVQIRGFRIEIGEIESRLLKIEGIENAFIVPKKSDSGFDFLTAYLIMSRKLSLEDIRSRLKQELPDFMVPATFHRIHKIPLTSSNKIDVKEMERIGEPLESTVDFVKPVSMMESKIAEIWQRVLNKKEISIRDNFFEIGGDSLSAIHAITAMEAELGREIPPVAIFSHYTIELLSRYLEDERSTESAEIDRQDRIDKGRLNRQKRLHLRKGE